LLEVSLIFGESSVLDIDEFAATLFTEEDEPDNG
jgi:hypothetical protein